MLKKPKHKEAHVARTRVGMGDYYGRGPISPRGRTRSSYLPNINPLPPRQLKKAPKSLA